MLLRGVARRMLGAALMLASVGSRAGAAQQAGGLHVLRHLPISSDSPTTPHFETHLAVDPKDPRHLIAASMRLRPDGKLGTSLYRSVDGGRRWNRGRVPGGGRMLAGGDPLVYLTPDGTALFVTGGSTSDGHPTTFISRSGDGGRTWSAPLGMPYRDRPWLGFDTTEKALGGTIYFGGMYGYIVLSRSTDQGRSFSRGDLITRDAEGPDPNAPIRGGAMADLLVTPDGVLVVPFLAGLDMADSVPRSDSVQVYMHRLLVSDDGGRSFAPIRAGPQVRLTADYRGVRAATSPRAAIDQSRGPHRGRIYLTWTGYEGGRYVVRLGRTNDLGNTWATTVVTDGLTRHDPSNVAVAVNRDGIVAVIWNDRRDDPEGNCFRLYGAISLDGGEHFLPNVPLSGAPACPNAPANWRLASWYQYDDWTDPEHPRPGFGLTATVPVRFPNGGDTHGLVADRDGVFHAAYIDGRSGNMQLWLVDFAVDSALVAQVRGANATATTTAATPVPAGWEDVTHELEFAVSDPRIDFKAGTLSITMHVVNRTGRAVQGPIMAVVDELLSPGSKAMGLRNFRVGESDSGGTGNGAAWVFQVPEDGVLARGEKSPSRTLQFVFEGGLPEEPAGYFEPKFRIYARHDSPTH